MTTTYQDIKRALAQGLVEYGLIIAFVAVLSIASLILFRPALPSLLTALAISV
jgi:Flp pilus assembly pilin Flp